MTRSRNHRSNRSRILYCNFCGRSQEEVLTILAGGDANICNKCVEECVGVLRLQGVEPFKTMTAKVLPFRRKDDDDAARRTHARSDDPGPYRGGPPPKSAA